MWRATYRAPGIGCGRWNVFQRYLNLSHNQAGPARHMLPIMAQSDARNARYTPQPNPTKLPTRVLRSTGTSVKQIRLTAGHNLYPADISGQSCCKHEKISMLLYHGLNYPELKKASRLQVPLSPGLGLGKQTSFTASQHSLSGKPLNSLTPTKNAVVLTAAPNV